MALTSRRAWSAMARLVSTSASRSVPSCRSTMRSPSCSAAWIFCWAWRRFSMRIVSRSAAAATLAPTRSERNRYSIADSALIPCGRGGGGCDGELAPEVCRAARSSMPVPDAPSRRSVSWSFAPASGGCLRPRCRPGSFERRPKPRRPGRAAAPRARSRTAPAPRSRPAPRARSGSRRASWRESSNARLPASWSARSVISFDVTSWNSVSVGACLSSRTSACASRLPSALASGGGYATLSSRSFVISANRGAPCRRRWGWRDTCPRPGRARGCGARAKRRRAPRSGGSRSPPRAAGSAWSCAPPHSRS